MARYERLTEVDADTSALVRARRMTANRLKTLADNLRRMAESKAAALLGADLVTDLRSIEEALRKQVQSLQEANAAYLSTNRDGRDCVYRRTQPVTYHKGSI